MCVEAGLPGSRSQSSRGSLLCWRCWITSSSEFCCWGCGISLVLLAGGGLLSPDFSPRGQWNCKGKEASTMLFLCILSRFLAVVGPYGNRLTWSSDRIWQTTNGPKNFCWNFWNWFPWWGRSKYTLSPTSMCFAFALLSNERFLC